MIYIYITNSIVKYQWYKNGEVILNENINVLSINNIKKKDYANYSVKVKNDVGSVISKIVQLLPIGLSSLDPKIINQPKNIITKLGSNGMFTVSVKGYEPLNYSWYKNGLEIPGATEAILKFDNFKYSDYGRYLVKIKNSFGEVISDAVDATSPILYKITDNSGRYENVNKLSPAYDDNVIYSVFNIYSGGSTYFDRFNSMIDEPVEEKWRISAIRASNGEDLWRYTGSGSAVTDPVVGANVNIYIITDDGNIH